MRKKFDFFPVISVSVCLSSCTMYPKYERPCFEVADQWRTPLETVCAVDEQWWKQCGDPVLDQLIAEALANNQDLKVAIARVDQFKAQLGIVSSNLYPQIELQGLSSRQKISDSITALPPGIQQVFNAFGFLFKASYYVDLWGEVRSAVDAAYHQWLASVEARRVAVLQLVSSVASTYIQLRQYDAQLAIGKKTLEDREKSYFLAQVRYGLGLTSEVPVDQALSEVQEAETEVENLLIQIAEAENLLSVLLGKPSTEIKRGLALDQLEMPPAVPAYLPAEIVCQRPDLQVAEQKLIAAGAQIGVARAKFFPQFTLTSGLGYESVELNELLTNPSKNWEIGATFDQEIFTGGRLINGVAVTEAIQREALHNYLSAILTAFKEVNDALTSHKIDLELVDTQRVRVDALAKYLHLADLRYQEGQTDYLTYLDAERQYFRSQLQLEEAKATSFLSLVKIYQALGGGWVLEADEELMKDE